MIKPEEGKRVMGFNDCFDVTGDSKEQFIQLGNAVTPPAVKWQIERAIQTLN
jgi:site-specific DNA-cytosine methylase